jgi:hypothetical protein
VRANAWQRKGQLRQREVEATEQKQLARVYQELDPAIRQAYQAKTCSILIERESVLLGNPAMDITDAVVAAVDARIKTLTFDRERLDQAAPGPNLCSRPRSKRVGLGVTPGPLPRGPMPDPRFFEDLGPATLAELASLSGARLADPADGQHLISHVAPLESADAQAPSPSCPTQAHWPTWPG